MREHQYGEDIVAEYRPGMTPQSVRDDYERRQVVSTPSDSESDFDPDAGTPDEVRVARGSGKDAESSKHTEDGKRKKAKKGGFERRTSPEDGIEEKNIFVAAPA